MAPVHALYREHSIEGDRLTGPDIFISYSREDRENARYFAECFLEQGFSVWWDAALHAGETFDEVIENELKAARAVVVLWTQRSVSSRWVRAEATLADRRNKLISVAIEDCDRPIAFELTHTIDLANWSGEVDDEGFQTLLFDVKRLVARDPVAASGAAVADAPRSSDRWAGRDRPPQGFKKKLLKPSKLSVDEIDRLMLALSNGPASRAPEAATSIDDASDGARTEIHRRIAVADESAEQFHFLDLQIGDSTEQRFIVGRSGLKIGRTAPADVVVADARVSRAHCVVELADNTLRVLDLQSTNGTFVDGHRIAGHAVLDVGSTLRVGDMIFRHELRAHAQA